jgi:hypothetical protein
MGSCSAHESRVVLLRTLLQWSTSKFCSCLFHFGQRTVGDKLSSAFSNAMATDMFNRMTGRTFDNISPATLLKFTDL